MIPQTRKFDGVARHPAVKFAFAGLGGAMLLALQACTTAGMPQPKYPIYMQDKPAEAAAPVSRPQPVEEALPPVTTPAPSGNVQVKELAPPPPPPPPVQMTQPVRPVPAPAHVAAATSPAKSTTAYVYTMQPKDTLFGVSRRFGVPVKDLYSLNNLSATSSLGVGQKITLPASATDKGVEDHANGPALVKVKVAAPVVATTKPAPVLKPVAAPVEPVATPVATKPVVVASPTSMTTSTTTTTTTKPAVVPPAPVVTPKPVVKPAPVPPVAGFPANAQIAQMGKGKFAWPVKGRILVPFGQLAPNIRNDGINIAAGSGTDVKAASEGVVVYEGDQVKELGNTIYIKHADGWYTGYSHLQSMKVKNNEHVSKGQVIGSVGQTGTIDQPQLHFEIRYTPSTDIARPIDPTLVLP